MGYILKGPIQMSDVANLLEGITQSYCDNRFSYKKQINTVYWDGDMINPGEESKFPQLNGSSIKTNYQALVQRRMLAKAKPVASDLVIAVNCDLLEKGLFSNRWRSHLKTRAVNKTLLEDLVSGQTVPATVNEYVIGTWPMNWCSQGEFEDYLSYRNQLLAQANERLKSRTSGAALRLLTEL
ncbi:MAG: hypothetical protein ACLFP2_05115 [Candidatus Woesearchaeota archaeon]